MKKFVFLTVSSLCLCLAVSNAQTLLKVDGGQLVVESGATLFVEGGIENVNSATITNQGLIELEGDFLNDATSTYDNTDPNTLRFSGGAGSNVTANGAVFNTVEIDKDAGFNVSLLDEMTVNGSLDFISNNNKVILGANNLVIQDTGSITGYDVNDYVQTDGAGYLVKENVTDGDVMTFPVGNDGTTYNPATLTANAGHAPDDISVRVLAAPLEDGLTGSAVVDAVDAMWEINEGTATGSDLDVTLEWDEADENGNFDRTESAVSRHDGSDWDLQYADTDMADAQGGTRWSQTRNNTTEFSPFTVGGESVAYSLAVPVKVFLQGAYAGTDMTDDLRTGAHIPGTEPYTTLGFIPEGFGGGETSTSFDQPADGDDVVDWVWIELRDAVTPTTVLATKSALLQRDGDVVDLDGASDLEISGFADGNYHIAVLHRNHLAIRTSSAQALTNATSQYDFTAPGAAYSDAGVTTNGPMVDLGGSVFGMWAGDANMSGLVNYQNAGNDKNAILDAVGLLTPNNVEVGYHVEDLNMNGEVSYQNAGNDKNVVLTVVGLLTPNNTVETHDN